MPKVLIVGAGYSGLTLAHRLLAAGHDVTVMTGRTSEELRSGAPAPLALTFPRVYEMERRDGLFFDVWYNAVQEFPGGHVSLRAPGAPPVEFGGNNLDGVGVAVDNRMKMSDWLERCEDAGARVVVHGATVSDLDYFSRMFDLVVVAVGGGELGRLFDFDRTRTGGAHPGVVTQATLVGVDPHPDGRSDFGFEGISIPDVGECFLAPQLTSQGPATCLFLMARPGQRFDCAPLLPRHPTSEQVWQVLWHRLHAEAPDVADRCKTAALVDPHAATCTTTTPTVRRPVAHLPSGGWVLGLADAVITTDARSMQQVSNSAIGAHTYFNAIHERQGPFTTQWADETFSAFWELQGKHAATISAMITGFWTGDQPEHFGELLPAVLEYQELKDMWITGWDRPDTLDTWMWDPDKARATIQRVRANAHART